MNKSPKIKKLERTIEKLESDNSSLRRWRADDQEKFNEKELEMKQNVCDTQHSADRRIQEYLQSQIDWLRSLVEDLTVSPEKLEVIMKHRKDEIHMENMNPMMEYHERPRHFGKKERPF